MDISEIGVLANPGSTRMVKGISKLRDAAAAYPDLHYRELSDIADVASILDEFAALGVRLLMIAGGDGTVQAVGTHLVVEKPFGQQPILGILPGGQTNLTAESLGLVESAPDLLDAIVSQVSEDTLQTMPMPFLSLQMAPDRKPVLGIFFGAATIVRGMQFTRRAIYPLGLPNGLSHFLAIIFLVLNMAWPFKTARSPMRREDIAVRFGDTASSPRPYMILLVTTLDKLILGIRTSSPVGEGPLRFTSIDYSVRAVIRALRTFLFGRPTAKLVKGLVRRRAASIEIATDCPVTLDGEFFDPVPGHPVRLEATEPFAFVHIPDQA